MKKINLLILLFAGSVMTVAAQKTINDPNAEIRPAKNFQAIELSSAFDVYLTQSNEETVAVSTTNSRFKDNIKVEVKDGVLMIRYENKEKWTSGSQKLKAYVSFKQLNRIKASGACDIYIVGTWKAENLKVNISGATNIKGAVNISNKLMLDMSGASDITLSGAAGQIDIKASGASNFKGYDLSVDYCDVNVSGASDVKITVNKELSAEASGASDIRYKGKGVIRSVRSSGASNISRKDG